MKARIKDLYFSLFIGLCVNIFLFLQTIYGRDSFDFIGKLKGFYEGEGNDVWFIIILNFIIIIPIIMMVKNIDRFSKFFLFSLYAYVGIYTYIFFITALLLWLEFIIGLKETESMINVLGGIDIMSFMNITAIMTFLSLIITVIITLFIKFPKKEG